MSVEFLSPGSLNGVIPIGKGLPAGKRPALVASKSPAAAKAEVVTPSTFDDLTIEEVQTADHGLSSIVRLDVSNSVTVYGLTGPTADDFVPVASRPAARAEVRHRPGAGSDRMSQARAHD